MFIDVKDHTGTYTHIERLTVQKTLSIRNRVFPTKTPLDYTNNHQSNASHVTNHSSHKFITTNTTSQQAVEITYQ